MLRYTLAVQELAIANGDSNVYQLSLRLKVSYVRAKQLWESEKLTRIGLDTIALLCSVYNCTPNDFILPLPAGAKPAVTKARKRSA